MKIKWLGHSSFLLEESTGTRVVTDPYDSDMVGYPMSSASADVVTVSHAHSDHNALSALNLNDGAAVIDEDGAYEVKGVHILGINSFHDPERGAIRGRNVIFKFRIDGVDVCHMGDIGEECNIKLAESIGAVDVLMIPVGGNYTVDAEKAKEYVDFLMPDIVIPMHYRAYGSKLDIDKLDDFLRLFDDDQIAFLDGDAIEFDRAMFEGDDTKVVVFTRTDL